MTPEDRDVLRAEAAMRILAGIYSNPHGRHAMPAAPRNATEEQRRVYKRGQDIVRMENALEAASAADALIAELEAREEFTADDPGTVAGLVAAGVAKGGQILSCKHGVPSFEPCAKCDEEDAAAKSGTGAEKREETGEVADTGNI